MNTLYVYFDGYRNEDKTASDCIVYYLNVFGFSLPIMVGKEISRLWSGHIYDIS